MLKRITLITTMFYTLIGIGQNKEQTISRVEIESMFLAQNMELLASELEISQAQAQVIQSKLWPNPSFEISEVNFWKTTDVEQQPILMGNWGKSQQISLHLEQEIKTAGKRRKNIELQKLTQEQKQQEFATILAQSKLDLRLLLNDLEFTQTQLVLYANQISYTKSLLLGYKKQLEKGNISQAEYIRLKAAQFQFQKQYIELSQQEQEYLKELKNFLNISNTTHFKITKSIDLPKAEINELMVEHWIVEATQNRADVWLHRNLELQSKKQLEIYKAERTPDLTIGVDFDRGGNIMRNFIGFGIGFDLPILDRNKGNIMDAKLEIQKNELQTQALQNNIANDILESFKNYQQSIALLQDIDLNYENQLEMLLISHQENFKNRNLSLIQYLDFVEAYLDNKTLILETKKQIVDQFENLQHAIGKEL
ncbi:TolC family protein [Myroides sp. LJL119]